MDPDQGNVAVNEAETDRNMSQTELRNQAHQSGSIPSSILCGVLSLTS